MNAVDPARSATAPSTVSPRSGRVRHIDGLRAAAVLLVVVMHAGMTSAPGDGGVVVFFVISGYIITTILMREREGAGGFDIRRFYVRRTLKLMPPLVVLVVVPTLLYAPFGEIDLRAVLAQLGFSYNWFAVADPVAATHVLPGTEVVWSLAIEEQFYIVFALAWMLLLQVRRWVVVTAVLSAAVALSSFLTRLLLVVEAQTGPAITSLDPARFNHVYRGTDTRVEAIAWGVLLALAVHAHRRGALPWLHRVGSGPVLIAAGLFFVASSVVFRNNWTESALRPSVQAVAAALAVLYGLFVREDRLAVLFRRVTGARWVQAVGLASYSIYLAHFPAIQLVDHLAPALPEPVLFMINVVAGLGCGLLCYRWVEVPVLAWRNRRGW